MPSPIFIDEPLIVPVTSGDVLASLSRVIGVLNSSGSSQLNALQAARENLMQALENGDTAATWSTLQNAQQQLFDLYESVKDDREQLLSLGFPSPEFLADEMNIDAIDIQSVTATFTIQGKQLLTSIAFARAANAKAYWLHEVRHFAERPEERVEDPILESHTPLFDRVRLAPGTRTLRIKARNLSASALSDEFTIEVPSP